MQTTQEIIIVYPNRHMRAKNDALNDMRTGYISSRAVKAMILVGVNIKFIKKVISYQDVTAEYTERVKTHKQIGGRPAKPRDPDMAKMKRYDQYAG